MGDDRLAATLLVVTSACACSSGRPAEVTGAQPAPTGRPEASPPALDAGRDNAAAPPPSPREPRCPPGEVDPTAWRAVDPASLTEDQLLELNHSICNWQVRITSAGPLAKLAQREALSIPPNLSWPRQWGGPTRILKRANGLLVGFDRGEWGGALIWYGNDGKQRKQLIDENLVELLPSDTGLTAFVGLAHLGMDSGRAVEVLETGGGFAVGRSVSLGSAPDAVVREASGSFLVATVKGLVRLPGDFKPVKLLESRWGILYPTSIALDAKGTVYVGMRGGVARMTPVAGGYEVRWLLSPLE